ncbi:MAG TPA: hypothetical protein VGU23_06175, partial [Acidobacteriaceae bacterium]|nr:hypothetical protein [Acidobacteriaceae bacterium]
MATPHSGKQNCLKPVNTAPEKLIEGVTKTKKTQISRFFSKLLEPRPHNNERILDRLVEVLERPDVL